MRLLQSKIFVDNAFIVKSDQIIPAKMSKNIFRVIKTNISNPHEITFLAIIPSSKTVINQI